MAIAHKGYPGVGPNDSPYDNLSNAPSSVVGSAVTDGFDPYARNHNAPYTAGISWEPQETPTKDSQWRRNSNDYQNNGAQEGLTSHEVSFYGRLAHWAGLSRRNHIIEINDKDERVAWADEGPLSVDPTPNSDGTQPTEPNSDSNRWSVAKYGRVLRAGIGYTFFRNWDATRRDEQGLSGQHISLSDNVVALPVGGMASQHRKNMRNTYRIEPEPWDLNLVDTSNNPADNASAPVSPVVPGDVAGRSFRLG